MNKEKKIYIESKFPLPKEEKAMNLNLKTPKKVYKYMNFKSNKDDKISDLENNRIWLSNINELNDPYECNFTVFEDIDKFMGLLNLQNRMEAKAYANNYRERYKEELKKFKNLVYSTSFCESKDSILMWSHYSDSHKGFCIEYEFNDLSNINEENLFFVPVIYNKNLFDISYYKTKEHLKNSLIQAFLTKSYEWEYENEWRIINISNKKTIGFSKKIVKPTCIYMGVNISEDDRDILEDISRKLKIKIVQMIKHESRYGIISEEEVFSSLENISKYCPQLLEDI